MLQWWPKSFYLFQSIIAYDKHYKSAFCDMLEKLFRDDQSMKLSKNALACLDSRNVITVGFITTVNVVYSGS